MRWQTGRRSENVEDRRGMAPAARVGSISGVGLLMILGISLLTGINPLELLGTLGGGAIEAPAPPTSPGPGAPGGAARRGADPQAEF
ncbi:MAG TPA: neutral zinc metallopeptidase, partial [Solirubrobacterales bacterium]|nr:neutral zinc metallopeptidase [Solirubrobacterales bacterium]